MDEEDGGKPLSRKSPATVPAGRSPSGIAVSPDSRSVYVDIASDNDTCLSLVWHGSMRDLACVMIVSCALARDFGAIISFEGEEPESLESLLSGARDALKDAAAE